MVSRRSGETHNSVIADLAFDLQDMVVVLDAAYERRPLLNGVSAGDRYAEVVLKEYILVHALNENNNKIVRLLEKILVKVLQKLPHV